MRQKSLSNNPRLKWVAETVLTPLLGRLIPQIVAAQKQGLLPAVDPILFSPPRSRGSGLKCGLRADYPPRTRRSWKRIGAWWTKWSLEHMRAGSLIGVGKCESAEHGQDPIPTGVCKQSIGHKRQFAVRVSPKRFHCLPSNRMNCICLTGMWTRC
jgi:hypothetical protein